jgi:hypothetical protein
MNQWPARSVSAACCLVVALASPLLAAEARLIGRVTNENGAPIAGAQITAGTAASSTTFEATSDPTGEFILRFPEPGTYSLKVDREGFYVYSEPALAVQLFTPDAPAAELHIVLQTIHEIRTALEVNDKVGLADTDQTTPQTTLSSRTLYDVPFPNQNSLRSGLRMIPGVVQDSSGDLHLFGGAETQAEYTFEGFQLNDPLTGRLDARMSLESIQSVDVAALQSGADNGRGASGTMAMHARTGGDEFKYSATNVFPGIDLGNGLRVGSWTPRGNISGPWIKRKAWFFNTAELQYSDTAVPGLPAGQNTSHTWRGSDLLHNQINLSTRDLLYIGLLYNYASLPHSGLTALDPLSTTLNVRSTEWFGYVKEQHSFSHSSLVELGFAASRSDSRSFPQGDLPYEITPSGRIGDNFSNAARSANRDQGMVKAFLPSFNFLGEHQFKTGADVIHLQYFQNIDRSAIDYVGTDGTILRTTDFIGSGTVTRANDETSLYVQDSWRVTPRLLVDLGGRLDRDQLLGRTNMSPRGGFGWSPPGVQGIRFSGGFARIFDPTDLRLFVRPLDQSSVTTYFNSSGAVIYGPVLSVYTFGPRVQNPRADVWSLGAERTLPKQMQAKLQLLRRRSTDGFNYQSSLPASQQLPAILSGSPNPGPITAFYQLNNGREDKYDSAEFSIRQPLRGRFEWMFSYTRSRALSNAVLDRGIDQPLTIVNNTGPLPWDAPNRIVSWGYLPAFRKNWALAYLLDWHTGFPFSTQDQYGQLLGSADSYRFGQFFELNLFAERQFVVRGYALALRGGFNNITGHQNANVVDNVQGGPTFLHEYGGQARALNFRLRLLGKQ